LWTFAEKKWRIEEKSLVAAWSHSSSYLDVLAQQPRLTSPASFTFCLNIKTVKTQTETQFWLEEHDWNSRRR